MSIIINKSTKAIQFQSHRPEGDNWMGNDWVLVPKDLEQLALSSAPYCELVFDKVGILVEIKPTEKPQTTPEPDISILISENKLLKAQIKAQTERSDFIEDCIAEMATQVYGGV